MDDRKKMIVCMEFIARHINNENAFNPWLMYGVPDGDIEYGNLDSSGIDDFYANDETLKDLMSVFLRRMVSAYENGGLTCDHVTSEDKNDN